MSLKLYILIALTICMGVLMDLDPITGKPNNAMHISASSQIGQSDDCDQDILTIMEQITLLCEAIGQNEVCYGNREVEALLFDDTFDSLFVTPGDLLPLNRVQSLRLSTLDLTNDVWGVAQLRLLLADFRNLQDVELLLFGDVYIEDSASSDDLITLETRVVASAPVNMRNIPDLSGLVVTAIQPDQALMALARSVDGAWILVEDVQMGYQGWVFSELITPIDEAQSFAQLLISEDSYRYWRPMQAFMFQSGNSSTCGNSVTDGMLIQTENGLSRITFLINEVVVELLPSANHQRAQALVQSNPTNGMNINMLQGQAQVTVNGTTYNVAPNSALNIPLDQNGLPVGNMASVQTMNTSQNTFGWLGVMVEKADDNDVVTQSPATNNNNNTNGDNPPPPVTNNDNDDDDDDDDNSNRPPHAGTPGPPPHSNAGGNKP